MPTEHKYILSEAADQDLEEIFDYGHSQFGMHQAVSYLLRLDTLFHQLAEHPEMGRKRDEIKVGLRSFPTETHVVFYRVMSGHIRIVRVLRGSRDLPRFLQD